jgi:carboxylate-amine ligase
MTPREGTGVGRASAEAEATVSTCGRRVGVEEELLLVDAHTGELRPVASDVLAACQVPRHSEGDPSDGPQVKHEFFLSQIEVATSPCVELGDARDELCRARSAIAAAGTPFGVVPVAVPGPVLTAGSSALELSPAQRYAEIATHYGEVARQSVMCALHVHVEVADAAEGVAVIDRVRPWIPVLIAISANSPYWNGHDSGYDSWRSRVWNMWPTGGPGELFGDVATYHEVVHDMVRRGAALDVGMVNLDVRLSHRYPTVEFRVADVCTDVDDALLVAALARALVSHCAERWSAGSPAQPWRVDELRAAAWRAARFGLHDTLVSPLSGELTCARDVLAQLVTLVADPLAGAGDGSLVDRGVSALGERGNGADRQRKVWAEKGGLTEVLSDLEARTLHS